MRKLLLAPFLAALVMFAWGFLYYGISGLPYRALGSAPDAGPQLDALFPASGTYLLPDPRGEPDTIQTLMERGPVATVHIHKGGSSPMDPAMLIQGFLLLFVCCILLASLLSTAAIPAYGGRVLFAFLAGGLITLYANGSAAIWWQQDWAWHLATMAHDVVAWLLAGTVLARFVAPGPALVS